MYLESVKKIKIKICIFFFNLVKKIVFIIDLFKEYVKSNY